MKLPSLSDVPPSLRSRSTLLALGCHRSIEVTSGATAGGRGGWLQSLSDVPSLRERTPFCWAVTEALKHPISV